MADELFTTLLGDDLDPSIFEFTAGPGYADTWNLDAGKAIANAAQGWFFGSITHEYLAKARLTLTPASVCGRPRIYAGHIHLTLTPQAVFPRFYYTGYALLRLTPFATSSLGGATVPIVIPASTGGWKMGGAGVWASSTPASDTIPAIDAATGLPTVSLTGFVFAGGTTEAGVAEAVSTLPQVEEIVTEGVGFEFCGPGVTGDAATSFPASEVIVPVGGFVFGGAGVWSQVAPGDLPSTVLVGSGGFVLEGTGLPASGILPTGAPPATIIIGSGGFKFGGVRVPPVEVTYPGVYDRVIEATVAFEMGGEGVWGAETPAATIIVSKGAIFALGGDGIVATQSPPLVVITGDGGFALSGTGWPAGGVDTWVLSGNEFGASLYANFEFQSYAQFRGKYYGAKEDGIYLLDGPDDAGEAIHSGVRLAPTNLGTHNQKRLRVVSIGNQSNGARVRVEAGDREGYSDVVRGHAFIPRNLQGAVFVIDLVDFDELSSLEIVPLIMGW